MLQEARGDVAGHPSYRRYHYAEGPLSVTDASGARFIGTDALGSTTDLTTTSGAVAAAHQYDAWGQYRNGTAPGAGEAKLGYTGHQYDPETGLVYARARYYDPEIGIFISRDSYEGDPNDAPSLHRYAYAHRNPVRFVDPNGHLDTAADVARRWEGQREEYRKWLLTQIQPGDSSGKRLGLALTTVSVELGAGMMDLLKLGEGAAEGGWRGWGKDTLRAVALGLMLKGTVAMKGAPEGRPTAEIVETSPGAGARPASPGAEPTAASPARTAPEPTKGPIAVAKEAADAPGSVPVEKAPQGSAQTQGRVETMARDTVPEGQRMVKYDPQFASEQILGEPWNTPGGRTIGPHAAERMVDPPPGRAPMTKAEVDNVLDTATKIRKVTQHPEGDTVTVQRPDLPGKPQVVVDAETGKRVITVVKNKPKEKL